MKYVIVGAGVAGVTAAQTIREIDADGEIVIIGKEQHLPYKRYLLRDFLCDKISEENLLFLSVEKIKELKIHFRKGQFVKNVDFENKKIKLFHNEIISYDRLLIATGGVPQIGPVMKRFEKYLHQFYSIEDVKVLKQEIDAAQTCIVYGQGLSVLDLMAGLHNLRKDVLYITKELRATFPLLEKNANIDIHQFLLDKGIKIITDDRIAAITKLNGKYVVETLNGEHLVSDLIFAWNAYRPNIGFLKNTAIDRKIGILVNEKLQTSVVDVFAAGDCAEIWHPKMNNYWINFGYPNAMEQGAIAGKNMAGKNESYKIHETLLFYFMGEPFEARWWE